MRFVLEATLSILREKLQKVPQVRALAGRADDLAMVELCVHHKVIEYADFIQIVQVINVSLASELRSFRIWTEQMSPCWMLTLQFCSR